jgi:DNA-binding response OmpR family regulator
MFPASHFCVSEPLKFDMTGIFPAEARRPERLPLPTYGGDRPRVLVADDDPVFRLMLFDVLARAGFEVAVAETGREAIAELRKVDHPPVAILGWSLAGMSGLEICQRMLEAAKEVYLILCHENPASEQIVTGLDGGADLVVGKSVPVQELAAHVRAGLRIAARLHSRDV